MPALPASAMGPGPSQPAPMGGPPQPSISADRKAELVKAATSPTWDEVLKVLRSDKLRGYRIDIETDSTILQDAQADKASRMEFMSACKDFLGQAYQALTVAPQLLPVVQEIMMFGVRSFKPGRALEETFEDAFDELAKNPPKPPGQEQATVTQDPNGAVKIQLQAEKIEADAQAKHADNQVQQAKVVSDTQTKQAAIQADQQHNMGRLQLEDQKHRSDASLKAQELALQERALALEERKHHLAIAGHNRQLVTEATATPGEGGDPATGSAVGPLEGLMAQLGQMVQVLAQGQQQTQQQLAVLTRSLTAPKRVVRGADGRAVGVESVLQ